MKNKKIIAIIQARIGSTRLPGKVLMNVSGKPVLWHVVNRTSFSEGINDIVIAIPKSGENDILEKFARDNNFSFFRGSEEDLLSRYYNAAKEFNAGIIVRINSDNPLVDPRLIDLTVKEHLNTNADYTTSCTIKKNLPIGLGTEVFNYSTLEKAYLETKKKSEREHVTPYIYFHPEIFKLKLVEIKGKLNRPELRLTLDTKEDLKLIKRIFKCLYKENCMFYSEEIIDLLDKNSELKSINAKIKQKEII